MINISFEDDPLYNMCVDLEHAEQAFGSVSAGALVNFISDANAFENVEELMDFLGGDIEISVDDSLFVAIGSDYRATLVVVGTRFDRNANGRIVWASVTRLKLVEISRWP
ncbi:hypothetical protein VQ045_18145 [Aurantimonas sp. E1-2-R+4]|uniref:hypothetical protein n=1 Tax=Aurantimonas sp. E1-2-R+4 TaxID=3113714 RepID=UPI002F928AAD